MKTIDHSVKVIVKIRPCFTIFLSHAKLNTMPERHQQCQQAFTDINVCLQK